MKTRTHDPRVFDFNFPACATRIRVEDRDDVITIRATRDTFDRRARERFIHHLAAEGFIPGEFQSFAFEQPVVARPVCWVVDYSWPNADTADAVRARRYVARIIGSSVVIWLVLMTSIVVGLRG